MRKVSDCRDYPSGSNCTLTMRGRGREVVRAAAEHAVSVHGEKDTPELRREIGAMLKDEIREVVAEPPHYGESVPLQH